jgi:hypothetical protein
MGDRLLALHDLDGGADDRSFRRPNVGLPVGVERSRGLAKGTLDAGPS